MKNNKNIKYSILIALILSILVITDIYTCPFRLIFGIPCPLCGMTRAIQNAICLNFKEAFYFHMFWPAAVVIITTHALIEFKVIKINKKIAYTVLYIIVILNLIYYFIRMFGNSEIILINIKDSLLYKILKLF